MSTRHTWRERLKLQVELEVFLSLSLLLFQTLRRLLECLWVTRHSKGRMHAVHYLLGFYFYTAVAPSATLHLSQESETVMTTHVMVTSPEQPCWVEFD